MRNAEMDEWDAPVDEPTPGRTPGRYIVYVLGALLAVVLGVSIFLALTLQPAADRFHNPSPATKK